MSNCQPAAGLPVSPVLPGSLTGCCRLPNSPPATRVRPYDEAAFPDSTPQRRTEDSHMAQISRRAVLLGVVGVGLAACSKPPAQPSVPPTPAPSPSPVPSATPGQAPSVDTRPRWPLTGKLLKNEREARHAAVAVKVPDNRREHPQTGIEKADIVFVELEGYRDASGYSGTRLVPVFHSRIAT